MLFLFLVLPMLCNTFKSGTLRSRSRMRLRFEREERIERKRDGERKEQTFVCLNHFTRFIESDSICALKVDDDAF